jgi:hypothetical protein
MNIRRVEDIRLTRPSKAKFTEPVPPRPISLPKVVGKKNRAFVAALNRVFREIEALP